MAVETTLDCATAQQTVCLDTGLHRNWNFDAGPVAVLHVSSTLHDRIAYCWSLAQQMVDLASMLSESTDDGVARAASMYYNSLTPLAELLEHLGSCTCNDLATNTFNSRSPL